MAFEIAKWHPSSRSQAEQVKLFAMRYGAICVIIALLVAYMIGEEAGLLRHVSILWFFASLPVVFAFSVASFVVSTIPSPVLLGEARRPGPTDPIGSFPVIVSLKWGELVLGVDEGILSFVDDNLCFEGERTGFAFGRQWVYGVGKSNQSMANARTVFLSNPHSCLHLEVRLPRGWNRRNWISREFNRQFLKWDTALAPTSVSTLPPLSPDPTYVQKLKWAVFCCAPAIAGLGVLGVFGPGHHNFLAPLPMLPATCMTASRYFRLQRLMRT